METKIKFAENLKMFRLQKKLTQKGLGELLGFSARTISDWECSNTEPDLETLKKLCEIFEITYEDILD